MQPKSGCTQVLLKPKFMGFNVKEPLQKMEGPWPSISSKLWKLIQRLSHESSIDHFLCVLGLSYRVYYNVMMDPLFEILTVEQKKSNSFIPCNFSLFTSYIMPPKKIYEWSKGPLLHTCFSSMSFYFSLASFRQIGSLQMNGEKRFLLF